MADKVNPDISWDQEAKEKALRQAEAVARRDPEAGALLVAQLIAQQKADEEQGKPTSPIVSSDYKPAKIYSFVARECGWTPQQIDEIHYLTFFAVVREIQERIREEQQSYK